MLLADFAGSRMTIAIGFFDGVHLGHQAILKGADVALTFKTHPLALLRPDKAPRLIMSLEERLAAIKACGVKEVVSLDFTESLARLEPQEFAAQYLGSLPCTVRCGDNWRFGMGGKGDAEFLRSLGYEVSVIPYAEYKGAIVSSTRIRAALEAGEIEDANAMLGRRLKVEGERFCGKGKGKELGYPTVNIRPLSHSTLQLPLGVYEVEMDGARAIANYGHAPTFGADAWSSPVWEIHFLTSLSSVASAKEDQTFSILRFIRPERKFASLEDLQRQIALDCATIVA